MAANQPSLHQLLSILKFYAYYCNVPIKSHHAFSATGTANCRSSYSKDKGRINVIVEDTIPLIWFVHVTGMTGILNREHLAVRHMSQNMNWRIGVFLAMQNRCWNLCIKSNTVTLLA